MIQKVWVRYQALFRKYYEIRWCTVHGVLGTINFGLAGCLYYFFDWHYQTATMYGHFIHVTAGYFADRKIVFQVRTPRTWEEFCQYWVVEAFSYGSIWLSMRVFVGGLGFDAGMVRILVGVPVSSLVSMIGNRLWTFGHQKATYSK